MWVRLVIESASLFLSVFSPSAAGDRSWTEAQLDMKTRRKSPKINLCIQTSGL